MIEIYFGFAVLGDFLCGFSVSNRPQCPLRNCERKSKLHDAWKNSMFLYRHVACLFFSSVRLFLSFQPRETIPTNCKFSKFINVL